MRSLTFRRIQLRRAKRHALRDLCWIFSEQLEWITPQAIAGCVEAGMGRRPSKQHGFMSRAGLIVYLNPFPILRRLKFRPMQDDSPMMLPAISCVEVVVLHGVRPRRVGDSMRMAVNAPSIAVQGPTALRIAQLWRDLPPGHQARCHIPPFGLRFIADGELICQGSICWECNNIIGDVGGVPFLYEFDAGAEPSQALLTELRRIVGNDHVEVA